MFKPRPIEFNLVDWGGYIKPLWIRVTILPTHTQQQLMTTEYSHWTIRKQDRILDYKRSYFIESTIMPEPSNSLNQWIEKYKFKRMRINARIPKEFTDRRNIFKQWKKDIDPEEFKIRSNSVLFKSREKNKDAFTADKYPHLSIDRVYYAKQYSKSKCGCTNHTLLKCECPKCIMDLSIYSNDQYYCRLVKLFEKFESVKLEEIHEWYIACSKNYESTKETIMADHDIEDSQLPVDAVDVDDISLIEQVEEPIIGSKRSREVYEQPELVEPLPKVAAIDGLDREFYECLQRALFYGAINEKAENLKDTVFIDEDAYQANPFAFI